MASELVDIGVNLAHDSFHSDRPEVIERARSVGVTRLVVTGTSVAASREAITLARNYRGTLFATAGIHPHHAREYEAGSLEALKALADDDCVVAIGECGLDFFRDFSPRDAQRAAFRAQLALAAECRLPVFLHQRDAHEEFVPIVSEYRDSLVGGVSHCFTGDVRQLDAYIDLDLHIGITGWVCDERRGAKLRAAVPEIPLERLLLETDAPYLLPRDIEPKPRSRRNEPSFLPHILDRVAELMALDREEVAAASTRNADALFGLSR